MSKHSQQRIERLERENWELRRTIYALVYAAGGQIDVPYRNFQLNYELTKFEDDMSYRYTAKVIGE